MRLWRPGSRQPSCHNQADGITGQPGGIGGTEPGQKSTLGELAHFRCPSIREISAAVGDRFFTRRGGLFSVELIIGGVLFIGTLRRTRLPFPSRMFEILVCAIAPALKQNTTPAVRTAFVIALVPSISGSCGRFSGVSCANLWVSFMPCPS